MNPTSANLQRHIAAKCSDVSCNVKRGPGDTYGGLLIECDQAFGNKALLDELSAAIRAEQERYVEEIVTLRAENAQLRERIREIGSMVEIAQVAIGQYDKRRTTR